MMSINVEILNHHKPNNIANCENALHMDRQSYETYEATDNSDTRELNTMIFGGHWWLWLTLLKDL
jgi:hypothetical protein